MHRCMHYDRVIINAPVVRASSRPWRVFQGLISNNSLNLCICRLISGSARTSISCCFIYIFTHSSVQRCYLISISAHIKPYKDVMICAVRGNKSHTRTYYERKPDFVAGQWNYCFSLMDCITRGISGNSAEAELARERARRVKIYIVLSLIKAALALAHSNDARLVFHARVMYGKLFGSFVMDVWLYWSWARSTL